ncbi:unnamed protein product [Dovyalis caffra]|uniref:Growth-regulating factor n=1 Tax=Dovyalis caffra TaxID=77055 RepID=A0AAV1S1H7_9ROSI|nr:unnamed protein product [Dovyalis caffra]
MDFHLKQWRNQHEESEQQPYAKMPKLLMDPHQPQQHPYPSEFAALPLFVPEPSSKISNLPAFPDSNTAASTRLSKIRGSHFSLEQWQELELQALIYRFMLVGAAVPPELLQPIKKSLLHSHSPPYFLHHPHQVPYPYHQPSWYCGKTAMDPEPGRCRRTDGKKWRCSRDVVAGHKYCERHVHRGRNRSRKPVENPTPTISTNMISCNGIGGAGGTASAVAFNCSTISRSEMVANGTRFSDSPEPPSILLNHSSKTESKRLVGPQPSNEAGNRSDGHILRHFFDDWPRPVEESGNINAGSSMNSVTSLSISMPGNSSSDVSLKLSTGNNIAEEEPEPVPVPRSNASNWAAAGAGWGTNITNQVVASMGGPLAEALRSSATNSSPTIVLHHSSRPIISEN